MMMLVGGGPRKKKALTQANTSWNEWLTYKGVSGGVEAARQKYTREPKRHWLTSLLLSEEKSQVETAFLLAVLQMQMHVHPSDG